MTILERLEAERVFEILKDGDAFKIEELCDGYFDAILTKEELTQLGNEIIQLAQT